MESVVANYARLTVRFGMPQCLTVGWCNFSPSDPHDDSVRYGSKSLCNHVTMLIMRTAASNPCRLDDLEELRESIRHDDDPRQESMRYRAELVRVVATVPAVSRIKYEYSYPKNMRVRVLL
eukprot:scaffold21204_cov51-Prasinocladus_malaysianus.AAC.1